MKKLLIIALLVGCSKAPEVTKLDVINGKLEVCNDLINMFLPPQLEKECKHDPLSDKILIGIKNPMNGNLHIYDTKTGEEIK